MLKEFEDELKYDEYDIINKLKSIIHDILVLLDFNRFDEYFADGTTQSEEVMKNIGLISDAYYKLFKASLLQEALYWARELAWDSDAIKYVVPDKMAYLHIKEYAIHYYPFGNSPEDVQKCSRFKKYCLSKLADDIDKYNELMDEPEKTYAEFKKAIENGESDEIKDELYKKYTNAKEEVRNNNYVNKLIECYESDVDALIGDIINALDEDPTVSRYSDEQKETAKKCIESYKEYLKKETENDILKSKDTPWLVQYAHTLY